MKTFSVETNLIKIVHAKIIIHMAVSIYFVFLEKEKIYRHMAKICLNFNRNKSISQNNLKAYISCERISIVFLFSSHNFQSYVYV